MQIATKVRLKEREIGILDRQALVSLAHMQQLSIPIRNTGMVGRAIGRLRWFLRQNPCRSRGSVTDVKHFGLPLQATSLPNRAEFGHDSDEKGKWLIELTMPLMQFSCYKSGTYRMNAPASPSFMQAVSRASGCWRCDKLSMVRSDG